MSEHCCRATFMQALRTSSSVIDSDSTTSIVVSRVFDTTSGVIASGFDVVTRIFSIFWLVLRLAKLALQLIIKSSPHVKLLPHLSEATGRPSEILKKTQLWETRKPDVEISTKIA